MRIAVCFSGQIRTGVEASDSIKKYFSSRLNEIDFFIHTWDVESRSIQTLEEEGLERSYENMLKAVTTQPIDPQKIVKMREIYNPVSMKVDNFDEYQQIRRKIIKENNYTGDTIPMFQSHYEANILKKEYEEKNGLKYDLVLKVRPDQIFNPRCSFETELQNYDLSSNILYVCDASKKLPNVIEDIMWGGNPYVMDVVSDFIFAKEQGEPNLIEYPGGYNSGGYVWQIQLKKYLDDNGIIAKSFKCNRVVILRDFHIKRNFIPSTDTHLM